MQRRSSSATCIIKVSVRFIVFTGCHQCGVVPAYAAGGSEAAISVPLATSTTAQATRRWGGATLAAKSLHPTLR